VTVGLSGDGGDEIFGGYNRYTWIRRLWKAIGWAPRPVRNAVSTAITAIPPGRWDGVFTSLGPVLPSVLKQKMPGDRMHKLAGIMAAPSPQTMYEMLCSHWLPSARIVLDNDDCETNPIKSNHHSDLIDPAARMMYLDSVSYLPNDVLTKLDRAAMAVSLETRVPLLDHNLVEFAWRIPISMRIRDGHGKWILRQVLYKYVPKKLVDRTKMGFGIPLDAWLRGALRDWAESLLDARRLKDEGFFAPEPIREKWTEHVSGRRNWQYHLWDILMFQAWLEETKSDSVSRPERAGGVVRAA
jgi:asparagine synthase (glutamine-hydrolysing)